MMLALRKKSAAALRKAAAGLLALALLLGCAGAGAEAAQGTGWQLYIRLDPSCVVRLLNGRLGSRRLEIALGGLALSLNGIRITCASDAGRTALSLTAAEKPLLSVQTETDGDMLTLVCDRLPGYALRLRVPPRKEADADSLIGRARALAQPYLEDLRAFFDDTLRNSRFSEDYSSLDISVSEQRMRELMDTLAARLRADDALRERLNAALAQINPFLPTERRMDAQTVAEDLAQAVEGFRPTGDSDFGTLTILNHQDGTGRVEFTAWGSTRFIYEDAADGQTVLLRAGQTEITAKRRADAEGNAWSIRAVQPQKNSEVFTCDLRSFPADAPAAIDLSERQLVNGDELTWDGMQSALKIAAQTALESAASYTIFLWSQFQRYLSQMAP